MDNSSHKEHKAGRAGDGRVTPDKLAWEPTGQGGGPGKIKG